MSKTKGISISFHQIVGIVARNPDGLTASQIADKAGVFGLLDRESLVRRVEELCKRKSLQLFRRELGPQQFHYFYKLVE